MKKYTDLFVVIFTLFFAPSSIMAAEYEHLIKEGIPVVVPVGGFIADFRIERTVTGVDKIPRGSFSILSINDQGVSFAETQSSSGGNTYIVTKLYVGTCKLGKTIIIRPTDTLSLPALKIKLLSVDMDQGTAIIEITKFWPFPNKPTTMKVNPRITTEVELSPK